MGKMFRQLDRRSALMMYLARELPRADQSALDERLAADADLRAELEALAATEGQWTGRMRRMDAIPVIGEARAVQRVTEAVDRWQTRRLREPEASEGEVGYPWWVSSLATAAVIVLAMMVWWSTYAPTFPPAPRQGAPVRGFYWRPARPQSFSGLVDDVTRQEYLQRSERDLMALEKFKAFPDLFTENLEAGPAIEENER